MYGDRMVPQTKVLPLVDMVIFHGGHNTLIEAFYFGKPMIVMPFSFDELDNAQKLVEEGFGIKMDPITYTKEELITNINNILDNETLSKRLKKISERIQKDAKSDKLAHIVEVIVK